MAVLAALTRLQIRQLLRSGVSSGRPAPGLRSSGRVIYFLAILLFLGWLAYRLADSWVTQQTAARAVILLLFRPALTLLGSGAVLIIFLYAFARLIGAFTEDGDIRLLLLAPIRPEMVVGEKLLLTSLGFSAILLITIPACFAVGAALNVSPLYYLAVVVTILLLPVAPVSLGAVVLMGLLRWLPPHRARTISAMVGTLLGLVFFVGSQLARTSGSRTLPSPPAWLPSTWPARFVVDTGLGDGGAALRDGLLSLALAAGLFVLATGVAARVLATGSASYRDVGRRRASGVSVVASPTTVLPLEAEVIPASRVAGKPRSAWWILMRKDVLLLRRDPQRLVAFLYPLFIVGFNAYGVLSRGGARHSDTAVVTTLFLLILAALLLVNTTAPGLINREGRGIALLALAPITTRDILKAKWIAAASPPFLIVELALIGLATYLRLPFGEVLLLALALAALVVALSGASLAANVAWPSLGNTNPRRQGSGVAAIVSLLSDAAISVFAGGMLVLNLFVWHGLPARLAIVVMFVGLALVIGLAGRVTAVLLGRLLHSERIGG